jgi:hypothetical protein
VGLVIVSLTMVSPLNSPAELHMEGMYLIQACESCHPPNFHLLTSGLGEKTLSSGLKKQEHEDVHAHSDMFLATFAEAL